MPGLDTVAERRVGRVCRGDEPPLIGSAVNARSPHPLKALAACGLIAWAVGVTAMPAAHAQGTPDAFLIYGNFCGPGNRGPGYPPIDALDLACAHHDACSPDMSTGALPTCRCNRRLQVEASTVAGDPRMPERTRQMAQFISRFASGSPCQ